MGDCLQEAQGAAVNCQPCDTSKNNLHHVATLLKKMGFKVPDFVETQDRRSSLMGREHRFHLGTGILLHVKKHEESMKIFFFLAVGQWSTVVLYRKLS